MASINLEIAELGQCVDSLMNHEGRLSSLASSSVSPIKRGATSYLMLSEHTELWEQVQVTFNAEDPEEREQLRTEIRDSSLVVIDTSDLFLLGAEQEREVKGIDMMAYFKMMVGYRTELYVASRGLFAAVNEKIIAKPEVPKRMYF